MEVTSVYIHIPFCRNICSYCDFCKMFYQEDIVSDYLEGLRAEMIDRYQQEQIRTCYIGGGTPSVLSIKQLEKLFEIVALFDFTKLEEFTFEMNPEDIEEEKVLFLKKHGVTRISIGHQTMNQKYLQVLGRPSSVTKEQILLVQKYFDNINVDFMYGFKGQSKAEFVEDVHYLLDLDVSHVSTYSLILEEHTKLFINHYQRLEDDMDAMMYQTLQEELGSHGLVQYEISNFSKEGYCSKHNLGYWNNQKYYGFGLGASGYLGNVRYTNTRSLENYLKGERVVDWEFVSADDEKVYEMILGLRKVEGVSQELFFSKFACTIEQTFDIMDLLNRGWLENREGYIRIPKQYLYLENQILVHFLEVLK